MYIFQEVTIDLLKESVMKHKDATAIFIEGYPRDKIQVEEFNKHVSIVHQVFLNF